MNGKGTLMTQRNILLNVLREAVGWVKSYELVKINTRFGWLGISIDRQARELAENGIIDRRQVGKYAEYRYKTPYAFGEPSVSVQERRRKKFVQVQESLREVGQEELI
jgi:hypothetical protein